MNFLVDYDFIAIFDADFKPEPDFLVCSYLAHVALHACHKPFMAVMAGIVCMSAHHFSHIGLRRMVHLVCHHRDLCMHI